MIGIKQIGIPKYQIGGSSVNQTRTQDQGIYKSLTKEQKDRIEDISRGPSKLVQMTESGIYDFSSTIDDFLDKGLLVFNAGELPEVVVGPRNLYIQLDTYYPFISRYKYTGHSKLGRINKSSRSEDYNLFTNNCADATKRCLEYIFNKQDNNFLFTTPGDVRDFALNKLHGIKIPKGYKYDQELDKLVKTRQKNNGRESILIPVTTQQMKLYRQYIKNNENDRR